MKKVLFAIAALSGLTGLGMENAQSRDIIQIAGSSTILPFSSIVAEEFGNAFPEFRTPIVGSGGSSSGLRQFCEGTGENTVDIANASRKIRTNEIGACHKAGVKDIREVVFGYDGIVFAVRAEKRDFALTPLHIYKALAAKVPIKGKMVANPYRNWKEIDSSLPDQPISLAIPASNHGTREIFEEKVILPGCKDAGLPKADTSGKEQITALCLAFRQKFLSEIAGDYTETLARLQADPNTIGVFGFSFYQQNRDTLKAATISGVEPTVASVVEGNYPVSRALQFYVKGAHIGVIPGIETYVEFFLSDAMIGPGGRLEEAGLIPVPENLRTRALKEFTSAVQAKGA